MAVRNKRPCRNCPQEQVETAIKKTQNKEVKLDPVIVTKEGEGQRLWNHVLFGTGTCVGMLAGYHKLGVPGDPLPGLLKLKQELDDLINKVKYANQTSKY